MGQRPLKPSRDDVIHGGYVLVPHGRFYIDGSNPETIRIGDIARSLSRKGRWSDLGARQIVVLEHTLFVKNVAVAICNLDGHGEEFKTCVAFHALHHDDHEAYPPGELPTPCKKLMPEAEEIGDIHQEAIYKKFGWPTPSADELAVVKEADRIAAYQEARVLFPNHPDAPYIGLVPRHPNLDFLVPLAEPARDALIAAWLKCHRELEEKLGLPLAA